METTITYRVTFSEGDEALIVVNATDINHGLLLAVASCSDTHPGQELARVEFWQRGHAS